MSGQDEVFERLAFRFVELGKRIRESGKAACIEETGLIVKECRDVLTVTGKVDGVGELESRYLGEATWAFKREMLTYCLVNFRDAIEARHMPDDEYQAVVGRFQKTSR